jgi:hypothetical protein
MSEDPEKQTRRNRLVGRIVIVGFGLLVLAYIVADVTYRMQLR